MNALLLGCGTGFGQAVADALDGYTIHSIGSQPGADLQINWSTVTVAQLEKYLQQLPELDLILFNQNGSALNYDNFETDSSTVDLWKLEKHWSQAYFNSCVLPFHIIKTLSRQITSKTKVCWVLSSFIYDHPRDKRIGHADYIGNKYQNYVIMRTFSLTNLACFFGMNPDTLVDIEYKTTAYKFVDFLNSTTDLNGRVYYYDGELDQSFDRFQIAP
jgi:hypothetical protein